MIQHPDDELLIKNLKKGDVLSYDQIFEKYNKKVFYFARCYLKNKEEAEDVVQEVFLNLWRFKDQINECYLFSKYLFKITYNTTCKKLRKHISDKKQLENFMQNVIIEDNQTDLDIEFNSLLENAIKLIDKLPLRQKSIFTLNIYDQLSCDQIAQKLNISKKTVENYLAMAKKSLRESLAGEGILSCLFFWLFIK